MNKDKIISTINASECKSKDKLRTIVTEVSAEGIVYSAADILQREFMNLMNDAKKAAANYSLISELVKHLSDEIEPMLTNDINALLGFFKLTVMYAKADNPDITALKKGFDIFKDAQTHIKTVATLKAENLL